MAFSSSLLLADLDYIAPSQACIKPMLQNSDGSVYIHGKGDAPPIPIKITLQDCLACSGCVTTAETMLVTSQSKEEVTSFREANPDRPIVVSVSDASAASLAVAWSCSIPEALERIAGFMQKHVGAVATIDLRWAHLVSLDETAAEYVYRLERAKHLLPMIISSCPGWVCYCEKTHPQLLPLLCPVMSAQGIGGSYLKHKYPNAYHISVQPCFDRKLEAVREDFMIGELEPGADPTTVDRMTNCVLSSHELLLWMEEIGIDAHLKCPLATTPVAYRRPFGSSNSSTSQQVEEEEGESEDNAKDDATPSVVNSCDAASLQGSGAYHQHCIDAALRALCGTSEGLASWGDLRYQSRRNANHRVISLSDTPISEVCIAYGFQHIQNLVRGINRKMPSVAKHTLIEVMACPEGCLNGGGQVRTQNNQDTLGKVSTQFQIHEEHVSCSSQATEKSGVKAACCEPPTSLGPRTEDAKQPPNPLTFALDPCADSSWAVRDSTRGYLMKARVTFRDRKAEMEQADNIVHSLKW